MVDLQLMDVFAQPTPYAFSFDLIFLDAASPSGFSLISSGQTLVQQGNLVGVQPDAFAFGGGGIFHFESLVSPGPSTGSCCGDVSIQWSFAGGNQWGIDNFILTTVPIPEPTTAIMLGPGLALLSIEPRASFYRG